MVKSVEEISLKKKYRYLEDSKNYTSTLYSLLVDNVDKPGYSDICDVLLQVSKKLDNTQSVEALINRLVNYIRITASTYKIIFSKKEEELIIKLGVIGQKAGLNGQYMADFSDKSQFYSVFDQ